MDFDEFDEQPAVWGVASPREGGADLGLVRETLKKEQVITDILAYQEGLRAMLAKVQSVQKEVDKLVSGNETLQMYIDNLTVQMAKRR
ncbi:hypothetical protein BDN70DRAFT_876642 [Pholiota conissans]|uniref:Uncharacterized protein n=1 Tax=Pholiota conissans TaxID=109636 RepID=A0A9P6D2Z8_9AGAR|nr:hypothetical protein BDN70DRAFT_876642 [Pholiota conissans]